VTLEALAHAPLARRALIGAGLSLIAAPGLAAPSAFDTAPWIACEARLRARLGDAGGCRFDPAGERAVLSLTNAARSRAGASALRWHDDLAATARAHAADLAQRRYVEHVNPEGFDPSHRFWLLARRTVGSPSENIAYHGGTPATAAMLMQLWRKSAQHWRNVLRPTHTHAGFGLARIGDRAYLVGLYANTLAELPNPTPFRVASQTEVLNAVRPLPPGLALVLQPPQGSRAMRPNDLETPSAVQQVSLARRVEGNAFEVIGGPIFLMQRG
jgi:uncharacterized protein YkwD